jgi:Na+/H+-dicarboxylate symporter
MLKMVVYPIILFSLIVGAASMPIKKSGKVGGLVMTWYMGTSLFATLFGVLMAYLLNPRMASATQVAASHAESAKALTTAGTAANASFGTFLTSLFQNPFSALANGQFLPIIVFAIAFGLAARWILDKATTDAATHKAVSTLITVCDGAQKIMFSLIECVVAYFPIGVFALSLVNFAENGTLLFGPYARITLCVVVGVAGMILLVYPLALALCCRQNPYRVLLRLRQAMLTAFVTRSSAATLPVSFKVMDELGVSRSLSSFSLPMGATINMDGVCVHLPVFVILAANMFGHHFGILDIATLCLMIMFASIGTGGIPGGSVFLLYMVLESMGLPADQIALVVALALASIPSSTCSRRAAT